MTFKHFRLLLPLLLTLAATALASTTWYVNGVTGSDTNKCLSATTACKTIGHAISLAASDDSVRVAAATYTENLTITINLTIVGAGAITTIIDGGGVGRVITISTTTAHVTISKLTIRRGHALFGGGISNMGVLKIESSIVTQNNTDGTFGGGGGGLVNSGTLTVNNSIVNNNRSYIEICGKTGCNLYGYGGGIANYGAATINNSTIAGNRGYGGGGGIRSLGGNGNPSLTINNSTITGNDSGSAGGGIESGGTLAINNSSISGNSASGGGGGIHVYSGTVTINNSTLSGNGSTLGSGIYGSATLQNSIVANGLYGGNCVGTITSNGYNLSSDSTCNFTGPGDMNNTDPMLGPLQNNGGPTQTMALPSGSPAIDAGNPAGCTDGLGHLLKTDQRGKPRPDKEDTGGCDIGAYESQSD